MSSIGSIFLRKKIDTQKKHHEEEDVPLGRYGGNDPSDNFFLFSPPEFSRVGSDGLPSRLGRKAREMRVIRCSISRFVEENSVAPFSLLLSTRCLVRLVCFPSLSLCQRIVRAAFAIVFLPSSSFDTISQLCTPQQSDSLSFSCRLGLILSYALQGWSFRKRW